MLPFLNFVKKPYKKVLEFFNKGKKRSVLAKKHAAASFIITGLDGVIGLLFVPLLLNYLDQTQYGIFLTMMSIISWFGFMDIGLGNGLRNKFAVAKANQNHIRAKKYVSTTYVILFAIAVLVFSIFLLVNQFISWSAILNVDKNMNAELSKLAVIVFGFFCLRFVSKLIGTIITADQKPAIAKAITLAGKIFILIVIFLLTQTSTSSLVYVGLAYTGFPVLVLIIASFYFYSTTYKKYIPSISFIEWGFAKDLVILGGNFFVIQISMAVLFMSDNIIISNVLSAAEVTPYQIANKYFQIPLMAFSVLMSPMWSAYTESYAKGEMDWIKKAIRNFEKMWVILVCVIIGMGLASGYVIELWVGEDVGISNLLIIGMALFAFLSSLNAIYTNLLNGLSKIRLQKYTAFSSIVINIPLSIYFAKYLNLGSPGVVFATNISLLLYVVTRKIQVEKLIIGTAKGIWDK